MHHDINTQIYFYIVTAMMDDDAIIKNGNVNIIVKTIKCNIIGLAKSILLTMILDDSKTSRCNLN